MTAQYKENIFINALKKRTTINQLNALMYWNDKVLIIDPAKAIELRNKRAKEIGSSNYKTPFKLSN